MDPRIAREWHKPVQNAILWEKNAKVEDYAGFQAFCRKKHEIFTSPVFKNPGIIITIIIIISSIHTFKAGFFSGTSFCFF